ncbi:hypothetical protein Mgra_00003638 [Meloidogyne graminicola]|uniref:Gelsolin-like domain-containing protein n=1 Tax=Meloidogyne graminicola TaxID=189291 RepID=A0A8S9ZUM2_9BILA|nr:hypothetical protein Mgra_00003638 [Meloidogyne graminicola]
MSTGVLSFVKGIDLSKNDFSADRFPDEVVAMTQATWLKLNKTQLERVPDVLSNLKNLEHLQMINNKLQIKTSGIPTDIFRMKDLTIIDFGDNLLRDVPSNLEYAKCAIVLNLRGNNIQNIPNQIFSNLIDLIYLDLSNNNLDTLPPQLRRLTNLQVLKLSNNPLTNFQFKQAPGSNKLRVIELRNTHRTLQNLTLSFEDIPTLQELNLAMNELTKIPETLISLKNLRKLDLSFNKLTKLEFTEGTFPNLETFNISGNDLVALPSQIIFCVKLQRLYANYNKLNFEGLPAGFGKLMQLQVLFLSHNNLELIPEGVGRCVKLRKLKLDNNRLITLPEGIHLLPDLKELDLRNNPDLVMPPKPSDKQKALAFYNIDFSLSNQLRIAGQTTSATTTCISDKDNSITKDSAQRKKEFIRRRRHQADQDSASKVIQGMSKVAKDAFDKSQSIDINDENDASALGQISWKENLAKQKPRIDYSDVFDDEVGSFDGLWMWEIENFYPALVDPREHGQFYEADSYLILKTTREPSGSLSHAIYYWIGEKTTLDKAMCAAVHAVNLRNHLGASCRTIREEMNDESDEFLELFSEEIIYFDGAKMQSGFYVVEKAPFVKKLYRAYINGPSVEMEAVPLSPESLDPRFVFLLDADKVIWIWSGSRSRVTFSNKVRLFAVKMNKRDKKGKAEIESCNQLKTPNEFWEALTGVQTRPEEPIFEHIPEDHKPESKRLYEVQLGMGYVELPQIELKNNVLHKEMLKPKCVFILDCTSELFVWIGKKASRLLKMAGQKVATEFHQMIERPDFCTISRETEGEESTVFRSKFSSWDDIVPFDFTMTADTVQRRGADIKVIMERDKMKTDLVALFLDRLPTMTHEEADQLIDDFNLDLEVIEPFVLEGKKFVRLPKEELGIFYTMDCYVFLCRYFDYSEELSENETSKNVEEEEEEDKEVEFKCVVYFWQGREASNMGWLNFTFSLKEKFETLFKDKLEVVRMNQQQENHKFLSHFKRKILIRRGRREASFKLNEPELFHMRANGSSISTRTIHVDCRVSSLNSAFCYILRTPLNNDDKSGFIYVWKGCKCDPYFYKIAEEVAIQLVKKDLNNFSLQIIEEGNEPQLFWKTLGEEATNKNKKYDKNADFMKHTRLFRCTNEKGYFSVSEKTVDFCQEDLENDDVMIVDDGKFVYIWLGTGASEVEIKLAYKAAQVYCGHIQMKQPDRPRKLLLSIKDHESKRFSRLFHGWGKHKIPAGTET